MYDERDYDELRRIFVKASTADNDRLRILRDEMRVPILGAKGATDILEFEDMDISHVQDLPEGFTETLDQLITQARIIHRLFFTMIDVLVPPKKSHENTVSLAEILGE
jgi:hypothetical protein